MAEANEVSPHTHPVEKDDFKCPICFELTKEPFRLKPCGHFTCKWCLLQLKRIHRSQKCPVCRSEIQDSKPHVEMEHKMAQLKSQCPGCDEEITLCAMKQHMSKCAVLMSLQKYDKKPSRFGRNAANDTSTRLEPGFINQKAERFARASKCSAVQKKDATSYIPELIIDGDKNCFYDEQEFNQFHRPIVRPMIRGNNESKPFEASEGNAMTPVTNVAPKPMKRTKWLNNLSPMVKQSQGNSNGFGQALDSHHKEADDNAFGASGGARPKCFPKRNSNSKKPFPQQSQQLSSMSHPEDASAASRAQDDKPKYDCPFCGQTDLNQCELMQHCQKLHTSEDQHVVCPLCASMPWGDPDKKSVHFISHLSLRHRFDYDAYMDKDENEAATLARAIAASLKTH